MIGESAASQHNLQCLCIYKRLHFRGFVTIVKIFEFAIVARAFHGSLNDGAFRFRNFLIPAS